MTSNWCLEIQVIAQGRHYRLGSGARSKQIWGPSWTFWKDSVAQIARKDGVILDDINICLTLLVSMNSYEVTMAFEPQWLNAFCTEYVV